LFSWVVYDQNKEKNDFITKTEMVHTSEATMMQRQDKTSTGPSEADPRKRYANMTWMEAYELRKTLEGYEVEELDGHDLARYLPVLTVGEDGVEEDWPDSSDQA
jgi:hypothetical protein